MSSPQYYRADETSPRIRNELGGADVVEQQDPPNNGIKWKTKADMKDNLIKDHLA